MSELHKYAYDEDGNIILEKTYGEHGAFINTVRTFIEKNEDGDIVSVNRKITSEKFGLKTEKNESSELTEYEYTTVEDKKVCNKITVNGILQKEIEFEDFGTERGICLSNFKETNYVYDDNSNLVNTIETTDYTDKDGTRFVTKINNTTNIPESSEAYIIRADGTVEEFSKIQFKDKDSEDAHYIIVRLDSDTKDDLTEENKVAEKIHNETLPYNHYDLDEASDESNKARHIKFIEKQYDIVGDNQENKTERTPYEYFITEYPHNGVTDAHVEEVYYDYDDKVSRRVYKVTTFEKTTLEGIEGFFKTVTTSAAEYGKEAEKISREKMFVSENLNLLIESCTYGDGLVVGQTKCSYTEDLKIQSVTKTNYDNSETISYTYDNECRVIMITTVTATKETSGVSYTINKINESTGLIDMIITNRFVCQNFYNDKGQKVFETIETDPNFVKEMYEFYFNEIVSSMSDDEE